MTIALIYDFDGTLSPGNMQEYNFIPAVGKSPEEFWRESNGLAQEQDADPILTYMYRMVHNAHAKEIRLRREDFRNFGAHVALFEGVREWFGRVNAYAAAKGITVHHYINSSGLKEMIEGTPIAHEFRHIYASSFLYDVNEIAVWPASAVNYTNKTQFIFKINKGIESVFDSEDVNRYIPHEQRAVRFRHMIYFGDGTTDIPCMRLVKEQGGHSIAVYNPQSGSGRAKSEQLVRDGRVSYVCPADYREGSDADAVVRTIIDKIAADRALSELEARGRVRF